MSGRHRRNVRFGIVAAAAATVLAVTAGCWVGYQQLAGKDCTGEVTLTVAAATEVESAVRAAAQRWTAGGAEVGGACVAVKVSGVSSPAMAAAVAARHKVTLLGLSSAPSSAAASAPDVWIPDSSTWLVRLSAEAAGFVPADGTPVAQSPVVLAVPEPAARTLGWPGRTPGWKDLLAPIAAGRSLRPGIADPTRDAAGLAGVLALGAAAGNDAAAGSRKVGVLRAIAANNSSLRTDLLQRFPQSAQEAGNAVSAAPLSEEDIIGYNAGQPAVPLAALYPAPATPAMNYPFAVMPEADPARVLAAAGLRDALRGPEYVKALAAAGLRAPDGSAGAGFTPPAGAPAVVPPVSAAGPKATAINQVLGSWAAITLTGRQLAVFDVSGSMLKKVPTAGGLSRAEVTQRAATAGLALLDDKWAVGNWTFSTNMVGQQAWKENVPITPLGAGRDKLKAAIREIVPRKGGDTGLYDTAVAAYRTVRDSWQAGRVNSVVLFTDGANDNDAGLTRPQMVAALTKLRDPQRPVRMVIIGIGDEVDRGELKEIADATGYGGVFIAEDPTRMGEIFLQAIATRTGA